VFIKKVSVNVIKLGHEPFRCQAYFVHFILYVSIYR